MTYPSKTLIDTLRLAAYARSSSALTVKTFYFIFEGSVWMLGNALFYFLMVKVYTISCILSAYNQIN